MKNLRFVITVLALVNAGLVTQAAASPFSRASVSAVKMAPCGNLTIGTE